MNKANHIRTRPFVGWLLSLACGLLCHSLHAMPDTTEQKLPAAHTVVIPPWGNKGDKQSDYFPKLLQLAFDKTEDTDGAISIEVYAENLSGTRSVVELKHKKTIDVAWYGATPERMAELLPVKISLLKELSDYRLLLIRAEDQDKFSRVETIDDLRKYTAGGSAYWSVTHLFREHGLPVTTVNDFGLLFPMLKAGRFDYISRNVVEVWEEAKRLEADGLVIEKQLLIKGGSPLYFFVNKNNILLANRIERGLNLALADGSFDELLRATPGFAEAAQEIKSNHRRVLDLYSKKTD